MPNTSCIRCSRPMARLVPDELCETCRRNDTFQPPVPRAPGHTPYLRTPALDPDPIAPTMMIGRPELPPPVLPGYDVRDNLGGGGMGVVYLAHETDADRLVALKLVRAASDPAARERFRVEVRAMARLGHPNVVRVFAVELDRPDPFFTMEYVDGPGLDRRLLADGPLPAAEAARVMAGVARAVQHAHDEGVIHRDLKPGNVVVGSDGVPKVTDFGLAKRTDAEDGLTVWDAVLGTPGFMAPEQTGGRNEEVGEPADVYGLGSTLYALLTGEPPFRGTDSVEVAVRVRTEPPRPPSELRKGVPAELEAVVLKCLRKDPAKRYASAGEVANELARWLAGVPTRERPPSRVVRMGRAVRRRRSTVMAGMVPFLLLFAASGGSPSSAESPRPGPPEILVGKRGMHRESVWVLGPTTLRQAEDGSFEFYPKGTGMLQLSPAPNVDRYRITAEIQQVAVKSPYCAHVGLYFGHDHRGGTNGRQVHSFFLVKYGNHLSGEVLARGVNPSATFERVIMPPAENKNNPALPHECSLGIGGDRFTYDPTQPPPWRRLEVEVTPAGIRALWRETPEKPEHVLAQIDAELITRKDAELQTRLDAHPVHTGLRLGPWQPQQPFGIYCRDSLVRFRNVILEPLPR